MIKREIEEKIRNQLFKGKTILVLGPRQVGKTTLTQKIVDDSGIPFIWLNGDEPDIRELLSDITSTRLKKIIGNKKLVVIDEAQRIKNIGITIKLIVDVLKDIQVIATGSSSLESAGEIYEPLTGRKYEHIIYPFSFSELAEHTDYLEERRLLEHRMIYGYYPEVVNRSGEERETLQLLSGSYLYKDLFTYEKIKRPSLIEKLLRALALQVGSEVSYRELGQLVGADNQTVEKYIDLMGKAFIVFQLPALSRNIRNEIKKGRKFYFYDNGIRNTIINNFNLLSFRNDTGMLWENFLMSERIKYLHYNNIYSNRYFWRTTQQQEIDYIEDRDGKLSAFEFKWNLAKKVRFSKSFLNAYPGSQTKVITPDNFDEFV